MENGKGKMEKTHRSGPSGYRGSVPATAVPLSGFDFAVLMLAISRAEHDSQGTQALRLQRTQILLWQGVCPVAKAGSFSISHFPSSIGEAA